MNNITLPPEVRKQLQHGISMLLDSFGEQVDKPGVAATPQRVLNMYEELLAGYGQNPQEIISSALFDVKYDEMVVVSNIDFYSLCEHHMMPFFGQAHIGYLPHEKIVGLSKIPRLVYALSHRLQVQERLTEEIANAINEGIDAMGVGVVMHANHMCAGMRGIRNPNTRMITSAMRGAFKKHAKTREEFMTHVGAATG